MQDCAARPVAVAAGRRKALSDTARYHGNGPQIEEVKGEGTCGNSNPAFVFGPEPGCTLTSALRASVRICLARPASSCWIDYIPRYHMSHVCNHGTDQSDRRMNVARFCDLTCTLELWTGTCFASTESADSSHVRLQNLRPWADICNLTWLKVSVVFSS